jgi:hypothetical protein
MRATRAAGKAMKVKIEIDCSPEEARAFFGMPDLKNAHDTVLKGLEARMAEAVDSMDPEALLKSWLPGGLKGFEAMQQAFWEGMGRSGGGEKGK